MGPDAHGKTARPLSRAAQRARGTLTVPHPMRKGTMNRSSPVGMMLQFAFGPGSAGVKAPDSPAADSDSGGAMASEMSPQMLALAAAARAWWEAGRPERWSLEQHLADPAAGCHASAQERALAAAVAQWVKQGS
jgi:hypothetical protein